MGCDTPGLAETTLFPRHESLTMSAKSARLTLMFSCVGHAYSHLLMLIFPTVVLALEGEFGLPYHELLPLMFLGNVMFGVMALPAGYLGDKWSAVGMMVTFFIGTGVACILTGLSQGTFQIAAGLALMGTFAAIYHPVGIAWVVRRAENRGKALGINGVFGSIGVGLASFVAAALTDWVSWRAAFIVPGAVSIATGVWLLAMWGRGDIADDRAGAQAMPAEASTGDMKRAAIVLAITVACSGLIYQATQTAMPKLFEIRIGGWLDETLGGVLGEGILGIGALVSAIYIFSGGAQILGGWLADRFRLKRVYLVCWALQIPLLLVAASLDSWLLFPVAVFMVLSNTTAVPTENSLFARYTPPKWRGTAFGVKFLLTLGISAGSIYLIAWIFAATGGFYWLIVTLAGLAVIGVIAASALPASASDRPASSADPVRPAPQPAE